VKVPTLPNAVTGNGDKTFSGAIVRVGPGDAPAAVIGAVWPHMTFQERVARVPEFHRWNGGPNRQLRVGDLVFARAGEPHEW
jgi:hypothetical protein